MFHSSNSSVGAALQDVVIHGMDTIGNSCLYVENGRSVGALTAATTSLTVNTNNYSIGDYISIGSEIVKITAGTYPIYTISRAQLGTSALIHMSRQVLKNYTADTTDVNGNSKLYLVEANLLSHASGTGPGITTDISKNPFTFTFRKYGYAEYTAVFTIESANLNAGIVLTINPYVVASSAVAGAYTGITIDGALQTVTITTAHTLQEVSDYCQYWATTPANIEYSFPLLQSDPIYRDINTGWEFILSAGISWTDGYLDGGGTINMASAGSYTLHIADATLDLSAASGTYDFTSSSCLGTITLINSGGGSLTVKLPYGTTVVNTGPSITLSLEKTVEISVPNLLDGTRVYVYNVTDAVVIDNSVVSGGLGYVYSYTYTSDKTITIKACYHLGTTSKLPIVSTGLLSSTGAVFLDAQEDDTIHNGIGVDGETLDSSMSGPITADFANIQIDISDPSNTLDARHALCWWRWMNTTESGISIYNPLALSYNPDEYNVLVDGALQIENVSASALKIINGVWAREDGGALIAATSNTIHWIPDGRVYTDSNSVAKLAAIKKDTSIIPALL